MIMPRTRLISIAILIMCLPITLLSRIPGITPLGPNRVIIAENPLYFDATLPSHTFTDEYLAHFDVKNAPMQTSFEIEGNTSGTIGYMLNGPQYEEWYESRPAAPDSYLHTFQVNLAFHLSDYFRYNGDYYVVVYNHSDDTVYLNGTWIFDIWKPTVTCNYTGGEIVSGIQRVVVNASDAFRVKYTSLYIDENLVANESATSLVYVWDTRQHLDGEIDIKIEAADRSGNTAELPMTVTIDNSPDATAPNGNNNDQLTGAPVEVIGLIVLVVIVCLVSRGISEFRSHRG